MANGSSLDPSVEKVAKRRRKLNLLIEITQALIAMGVTGVTLYVSGKLALEPESTAAQAASLLLSNAFFLVIGYYFGRQNPRPGQRVTDLTVPPTDHEEDHH